MALKFVSMKDHPAIQTVFKLVTSLRLTVVTLALSMVVVFMGTVAQSTMGLKLAVDRFFKQFFIDSVAFEAALAKCAHMFFNVQPEVIPQETLIQGGFPVFPGGYLLGAVLLVNLMGAYYSRFVVSWKKAGIILTHLGIIMLLVGQVLTDVFAVESYVAMEAGDRRNYSESHDHNELVVLTPLKNGSNQVVSIPEWMLEKGRPVKHPALGGATIRAVQYWRNAQLAQDLQDVLQGYVDTHKRGTPSWEQAREQAQIFTGFLGEARVEEELKAWKKFTTKLTRLDEEVAQLPEDFKRRFGEFARGFSKYLKRVRTHKAKDGRVVQTYRYVVKLDEDFGMDARNLPTVVLEVRDKSGKVTGTWLASTILRGQTLTMGGKERELVLRGKRYYHNYSLTLMDLKWEKYPGTETPKNYESIVLVQPQGGEAYVSNIKMNEPFRIDGKTHYQHQLGQAALASRSLYTQLAVVQNPSYQIPYIGCLVVAAGMLYQFLSHLVGFVNKRRKE